MAARNSESRCTGPEWPQRLSDPFFPFWLNPETGEYVLLFGDRVAGSLIIYYCPSCGGRMPKSRRGDLFCVPSNDELRQAKLLLEKVSDTATMRSLLGEPDDIFEGFKDEAGKPIANPEAPRFIRQYKYSSRWKTLQLTIQESEEGPLRFFFYGQSKGRDSKNGE